MTNTGRFAPSPTGDFHLGNLRTAILAWAWARTTGRRFVLRIEDIDRERAGSAERQIEDLAAIGVDWDGEPLIQTERADAHEAALASLAALGREPALRLAAPSPEWTVFDELHGSYTGAVDHFVVRRADGVPAYNLAAVVDDAFQGVDQVVRGFDLLSQAPAQAQLAHLLGAPEPTYAHVPLALAPSGARLAKRDGAVTLSDLRGLGWSTEDVVSFIGSSLGVPGARCASDIADALGITGLRSLPTEPWVVTPPSS